MKESASTWFRILCTGAILIMGGFLKAQSFEGSVSYSIRLTGKGAADILMNEPPKKMDLHVKEDNFILSLTGGRIARTFLFIGDSSETYSIDVTNKKAYRNTYYRDTTKVVPTAVSTGKTMLIKGETCQEFVLEKPKEQETVTYYVTDKYRVDPKLYEGKKDAKADFLTPGLDGRIPFRKVIKTPDVTTEIDLTSIKSKSLDKENFMIPDGFIVKKRDPRM